MLFVDLSSSTALADQTEAEAFAAAIDLVLNICSGEVIRRGGMVARLQGDGMLAAFGLPEAGEDDGRRACEAALAIRDGVAALAPVELRDGRHHRLQVHAGVHAGLVLVSDGSIEVGRMRLLGDAPNTAARLAAMARAGQILVDADSLGPAMDLFVHGPAVAARLPGREAATRVLEIAGRSLLRTRLESSLQRGLSPFLGRAGTMDDIVQAMGRARRDCAQQIVVLQGESGIGKSRLLFELGECLAREGWWPLRGYCQGDTQAPALQPFVDIAEQVRVCEGAGAAPARDDEPRAMVFDVWSRFLHRHPVLMLDDWQWADDASRQLLSDLAAGVPILRVIIAMRPVVEATDPLATASPAYGEFSGALSVRLAPFTLAQTVETVGRLVPGTDPYVAAEIHAHAGGVPLFVEELCHALHGLGAYGLRQLRGGGVRIGTPGWMATLVASRLASLTLEQRRIAQAAAVLGTAAPMQWLAGVLCATPGRADLDTLGRADLLYVAASGELAFKHGLTRDALYELIPLDDRKALHARATEFLARNSAEAQATPEAIEAIAFHAEAAGKWSDATRYCEAAGDRTAQRFALDRARAHYLAAVKTAERAGVTSRDDALRWCRLVHKLGMACIFDVLALPDVMPVFERGLERARHCGDEPTIARSAYWLGYLRYGFGWPRQATWHLRHALEIAEPTGDARLVAQVQATLGQAEAATCEYDAALQRMHGALSAKRQSVRSGSAVAVGSAFTLACQASIWGDRGDFDQAHAALAEAHELVGSSSHPVANSIRNWQMVVLAWQGRWDEALEVVEQSVVIAARTRALLPLAIAHAVGGHARWMRDHDAAALEDLRGAVRWFEQRGGRFYTSIYYGWLVGASVACELPGDARRYAGSLLARARAGERIGMAAGWRALALAAARDDPPRAQRWLDRSDASALARGSRRDLALNDLRRSLLDAVGGNPMAARERRRSANERLRAMGMDSFADRDPTSPL